MMKPEVSGDIIQVFLVGGIKLILNPLSFTNGTIAYRRSRML